MRFQNQNQNQNQTQNQNQKLKTSFFALAIALAITTGVAPAAQASPEAPSCAKEATIFGKSLGMIANVKNYLTTGHFSAVKKPVATAQTGKTITAALRPVKPQAPASLVGCKLERKGQATYYGHGDGFAGQKTKCGMIMRPNSNQVASNEHKCGTKLKLRDPATGRIEEGIVGDTGSFSSKTAVDMAAGLFKKFAPLSKGRLHGIEVYNCNSKS